ncbi:hypothetical protein B0T26DRAFT_403234 [Lasiosphaeria miniovina]|uniref:Uncharacterized protein n=1 Tax=Lasiosphaeria miniovina TaxID=1954250 RepID=A0AA40DRI2_9PEZI|nr:uncharacterized protein B0T26DRAFT_403234 [Lasiosphaeria miniovina]KAK0709323.1 hypothetical protein B0T26DRAFT_403234 [Lasiosphaeria miniovina]
MIAAVVCISAPTDNQYTEHRFSPPSSQLATMSAIHLDRIAKLTPETAREIMHKMQKRLALANRRSVAQILVLRDELKAMDDKTLAIQRSANQTWELLKELKAKNDARLYLSDTLAGPVIEQIMHIRSTKPMEKMIVVSNSDTFLDTISEGLYREFTRRWVTCGIGRFDNYFVGKEHAQNVVRRLNNPSDNLCVVLLSAVTDGW